MPAWLICNVGQRQMKIVITFIAFLAGSVAVLAEQKKGLPLKPEELIGVWRPDKESMREIEARIPNHMPPEIQLLSQGGFTMDNIPGWWRNVFGHPSFEGFFFFRGTRWDIKGGTDGPEVLLQGNAQMPSLQGNAQMVLSIEGEKPPYFILLHVGGMRGNAPVRFYRKIRELNKPNQSSQPSPGRG